MAWELKFDGIGYLPTPPWQMSNRENWKIRLNITTSTDVNTLQVILGDGTDSAGTRALRMHINAGNLYLIHTSDWSAGGRLDLPILSNTNYEIEIGIFGGNFVLTSNGITASQPRTYNSTHRTHLEYIGARNNGTDPFVGSIGYIETVDEDAFLDRYCSADASDHNNTGVQPVFVDIIGGYDATGINMPTDGSAWIDLGGGDPEIIVTAQTGNYSYNGLNATIELGAEIIVTAQTANYNYSGIDAVIDLTGEIIVTASTGNYNYTGIDAVIELGTEIVVTAQTANYNYSGIDAAIELGGEIIVTAQTANYDYSGVNANVYATNAGGTLITGIITLPQPIVVTAQTGNYNYGGVNAIITARLAFNSKHEIKVKRKTNTIIVKRTTNKIRVK